MTDQHFLMIMDSSEERWTVIIQQHREAARQRVAELLAEGRTTETGCIVTDTKDPRKVRFAGSQFPAYRFIYCVLNDQIASYDDVIRHRCHNRLCINPDHLTIGTRGDNKQDDYDREAYGVDFFYL